MSRFDLFFVALDERNSEIDENIAKHILQLHMGAEEFGEEQDIKLK